MLNRKVSFSQRIKKASSNNQLDEAFILSGGEREIRTLGTCYSSHDFQSCALDQLSHLSV